MKLRFFSLSKLNLKFISVLNLFSHYSNKKKKNPVWKQASSSSSHQHNCFTHSLSRTIMYSLARSIPRVQLTANVFRNSLRTYVAVGDKIPHTTVYEGSPGNEVDLAEETASGKSIVIGVPGAFSPGCSKSHVPGFIKNVRAFNDKGYQKFFVVAVNDAFVTKAWGDQLLESIAGQQIRFIADPSGAFTKDLDLLFDASKFFGNERSKRYALIVEDGEVKKTFVEPDNTSVEVSSAAKVLDEA